MSAGITMLLAGAGAGAGAFAGAVVAQSFYVEGSKQVTYAAAGGAIGAALATFIGITTSAVDEKKTGTLSGPPRFLGFP